MKDRLPPIPKKICIYHAKCQDGLTAAAVVYKYWTEISREISRAEFVPFNYQSSNEEFYKLHDKCCGADVVVVDFSFSVEQTKQLADAAHTLIVLDHHESAVRRLEGEFDTFPANYNFPTFKLDHMAGCLILDMERSGARMAWDFFFPYNEAPPFILRVEDRDLWRWKFGDESKWLHEYLAMVQEEPQVYWQLLEKSGEAHEWDAMLAKGALLRRYKDMLIAELAQSVQEWNYSFYMEEHIGDKPFDDNEWPLGTRELLVYTITCPKSLQSDMADYIHKQHPDTCVFVDMTWGNSHSLRSNKDGKFNVPVNKIAEIYGGGGHRNAAGYKLPQQE